MSATGQGGACGGLAGGAFLLEREGGVPCSAKVCVCVWKKLASHQGLGRARPPRDELGPRPRLCAPPARAYPELSTRVHGILVHNTNQDTQLVESTPGGPDVMTLHPRCQCSFMEAPRGPHRSACTLGPAGLRVMTPNWVANQSAP